MEDALWPHAFEPGRARLQPVLADPEPSCLMLGAPVGGLGVLGSRCRPRRILGTGCVALHNSAWP